MKPAFSGAVSFRAVPVDIFRSVRPVPPFIAASIVHIFCIGTVFYGYESELLVRPFILTLETF